ncbi:MAG TPA: electron transport complex subunit RsxC [Gammaproteobacteria bacterium]
MRLFRFRGGVHPDGRKESAAHAIIKMPLPRRLRVPMQQHIGAAAEPVVRVGQQILKGQLLGSAAGAISAPVHAPTSGTVVEMGMLPAAHPSGLPTFCVVIEPDGKDLWDEFPVPRDPLEMPSEIIAERVAAAGVVGLGGATFPSAVKLGAANNRHIHTIIINGGECEPYLTCDDRLMRERAEEVIDGVRIILHAVRWGRAVIAIEDNKPEAIASMKGAAHGIGNIKVLAVPARYPAGSEKQLIVHVTGREVPAGALPASVGVLMHNVGTAYAIHQAIRFGQPLVSRIVTVAGATLPQPRNVEVPIGTLVSDLLEFCGVRETPTRLLMGGPMMGMALPHADVPIIKGTSGVLALAAHEVATQQSAPCVRCGRCVNACPVGLVPLEMAQRTRLDDLKGAEAWGVMECIACGSCSYVCPSHIPLVHFFNYAKGKIALERERSRKANETRQLAEARRIRVEREEAEKKARAAEKARARAAAKQAAAQQTDEVNP